MALAGVAGAFLGLPVMGIFDFQAQAGTFGVLLVGAIAGIHVSQGLGRRARRHAVLVTAADSTLAHTVAILATHAPDQEQFRQLVHDHQRAELPAALNQFADDIGIDLPAAFDGFYREEAAASDANSSIDRATGPARAETVTETAERWRHAQERHQRAVAAYGTVVADPLNALEHSGLFDVDNPDTHRFLLTLTECDDICLIPRGTQPTHEQSVAYADAARRLTLAWETARDRAARAGSQWLPEHDQSTVRRAVAFLRTAAGQAATPSERSLAIASAEKAIRNLRALHLPSQTLRAIEQGGAR